MPYLPPRRFRPVGTQVGTRPIESVANRPGFVDYTMPRWLRDALSRAKGQQPPPRNVTPNFQPQGQPPPRDQGPDIQAAIDASAASRGRGTNRADENRASGGAGGFDISFGRGDVPIPQDILNRAQGLAQVQERGPFIQDLDFDGIFDNRFFRGIGETVAQFLEPEFDSRFEGERGILGLQNFVFPGTERFIGATEQFNHDRGVGPGTGIINDLFGQGRGVGLLESGSAQGGVHPGLFGGGGGGGSGITSREDLLAQYNAGIGRGPSTEQYFGAGPNLGGIDQYYSLLDPPPASFSGAGGFGGGGGFNFDFPEGDPADPRFWLDLVRWLI